MRGSDGPHVYFGLWRLTAATANLLPMCRTYCSCTYDRNRNYFNTCLTKLHGIKSLQAVHNFNISRSEESVVKYVGKGLYA